MNLDLSGSTSEEWIASLPPMHARTIGEMTSSGHSLDEIGLNWLAQPGPENTFPFGAASAEQKYWNRVLEEVRKLICGDPSYEDLRKKIAGLVNQHKAEAIGAIAAAVGAVVGLSAVVLVPVVGIVLAIVCRVGVNAWCLQKN